MATKQNIATRVCAILVVVLIAVCAWYPPIQTIATSQIDAGLKRALISFASARTLNALISVLQGTEFSFQPLGVGVTLTLGQILDPINDLVEQFSSLMLLVSVIFGLQKILLVIGGHWLVSTVVCGLACIWAALVWRNKASPWMARILFLLLMVRFAIPAVSWGSDLVFHHMQAKEYQEHQSALDRSVREVSGLTPQKAPAAAPPKAMDRSLLDKIKERIDAVIPNVNGNYEAIKTSVAGLPERIVNLIVIFVAQTIVIPIVMGWIIYFAAFGITRSATRN